MVLLDGGFKGIYRPAQFMKIGISLGILVVVLIICLLQQSPLPPVVKKSDKKLTKGKAESKISVNDKIKSIANAFNEPMLLNGIVVDENDRPLADVEVFWSTLKGSDFVSASGQPRGVSGKTKTDSFGKFKIQEYGTSIAIDGLKKNGYNQSKGKSHTFGYGKNNPAPYKPDELNPEKFLMFQTGIQTIVEKRKLLRFDWNGTPTEIPIQADGGEEILILTPVREEKKPGARGYNWSLKVELKNGTLILGKYGDAPMAPAGGYTSSLLFGDDSANSGLRGAVDGLIYLKSGSGLFGQLKLHATSSQDANSDTGSGDLSIRWNLQGGRAFP